MNESDLAKFKLSKDEYKAILDFMKKQPNELELSIISSMWSEHCSYKSSKIYLEGFFTKAPWVIKGPGENAGVINIGEGMAAVFKIESHNHPSYIEPVAGSATGVGGIFRDVFTMGARVVCSLNSLKFGDLKGANAKYQKYLVKGVAKGLSQYGNCMGVPTIGGECGFDESYDENILVNAFALGVCKQSELFYAKSGPVGALLVYVGAKTGKDGLGGAVMASDSFDTASKSLRPTVQIGDPFCEKLLMEACLELFKKDYIYGIQDMGAAGLSSSSFEMASKSDVGMRIDLCKVPTREKNMTPLELMLSESQERMLISAKPECIEKIIKIFKKYSLEACVIGEVIAGENMELFFKGEKKASIAINPLAKNAPKYKHPTKKPSYMDGLKDYDFKLKSSNEELFKKLLADPNISNKSFFYQQFDSSVGTNTILADGKLGASIIRVKENSSFLSIGLKSAFNQTYLDPLNGAAMSVANSFLKVACSGAKPLGISDCLNYASPLNKEIMWQFAKSCEGIKTACKELFLPVVSGNVSLYNESNAKSIKPTPSIACVGLTKKLPRVAFLTPATKELYLLGELKGSYAASAAMKLQDGVVAGSLQELDYKLLNSLSELLQNNDLECAKCLGQGGLAITLAKMACVGGVGVRCEDLGELSIFTESFMSVVVGVRDAKALKQACLKLGIPFQKLGICKGDEFILKDIRLSLKDLQASFYKNFERLLA